MVSPYHRGESRTVFHGAIVVQSHWLDHNPANQGNVSLIDPNKIVVDTPDWPVAVNADHSIVDGYFLAWRDFEPDQNFLSEGGGYVFTIHLIGGIKFQE